MVYSKDEDEFETIGSLRENHTNVDPVAFIYFSAIKPPEEELN